MSDQEVGKKLEEHEQLGYFLEAYARVTGQSLTLYPSECPDFVGERPDGSAVGVELTSVSRDPESAFWDETLRGEPYADPWDVLDRVAAAAARKFRRAYNGYAVPPSKLILLLVLHDAPVREIRWVFDDALMQEWAEVGFAEIWIGDYTDLDAYGDIELFCLCPHQWWGYHQRPMPFRKPYG